MAKYSFKQKGKEDGPASVYAEPHISANKKLDINKDVGIDVVAPTRKNWTPLNGGVSIGNMDEVETDGIKVRGTGAAPKGLMARGPMA